MKRTISLFAAAMLAVVPMADIANAKDKHKNKNKHGNAEYSIKSKPGQVKIKIKGIDLTSNCPPGLAKKNPPCIPPGLVRAAPAITGHYHDDDDHDHDVIVIDRDATGYTTDGTYTETTTYSETTIRQLTQVTTVEGEVIRVGDVILDAPTRYSVLTNPALFGLPLVPDNTQYLRVGDTAVQLDPVTQRVMTILALANVLIK